MLLRLISANTDREGGPEARPRLFSDHMVANNAFAYPGGMHQGLGAGVANLTGFAGSKAMDFITRGQGL
mgnify:CR=1 FL=1